MKARSFLMRVSIGAAGLIAALAMAAPPVTQAAAPPILVDTTGTSASDCGSYTGQTSSSNPVTAIAGAASGSTVLFCPGEYDLTSAGIIGITGKTLTLKRALTGPDSRPILKVGTNAIRAFSIAQSNVTLDGLIVDGRPSTQANYVGIELIQSSATIKNSGIIGTSVAGSVGVAADSTAQTAVHKLSITNSYISGFRNIGVRVKGPIKVTLTSSYLDGTNGGTFTDSQYGVMFDGQTVDASPTGTVTKCRILNSVFGISVAESSKVSITNNTLVNHSYSIYIATYGLYHNADNIKITGNTIMGTSNAIQVENTAAATFSVKKLTISKNVIAAAHYAPSTFPPFGVYLSANVPAPTMMTVTVSGNTFMGFSTFSVIYNVSNNAGLTSKSNDTLP